MRDIKRIKRILNKLEKIWKQNPDYRFFQLMYQIQETYSRQNDGYGKVDGYTETEVSIAPGFDFFHLEDDKLEVFLEALEEHTTN